MPSNDNRTSLEEFIGDCCYETPGVLTPFKDFCNKFFDSLTTSEQDDWNKAKVIKGLPSRFPLGMSEGVKSIANIALEKLTTNPDAKPLIYVDGAFITKD
jgi:hypothetical protein